MATEIATTDQMDFLTLAPNSELSISLATTDERQLTDDQFAMVVAFASAAPPALPIATDLDVRAVIGSLAAVKKRRNASIQEGRLQLGLYRKLLVGIPMAALKHAGEVFLRQEGWMPEPAEVLAIANQFSAPEHRDHARARLLTRERRQRLFNERCRALKERTFPPDQFHTLTPQELVIALHERAILIEIDGTIIPWTLADEERISAQRRAQWALEGGPGEENERSNRASEGGSSGSIGGISSAIVAGMEASDGA